MLNSLFINNKQITYHHRVRGVEAKAFAVIADDTLVSSLDINDLLRFRRAPQHHHGHGGSVHKLNPIHQDMYSIVFIV